jgi:hypothetical protein
MTWQQQNSKWEESGLPLDIRWPFPAWVPDESFVVTLSENAPGARIWSLDVPVALGKRDSASRAPARVADPSCINRSKRLGSISPGHPHPLFLVDDVVAGNRELEILGGQPSRVMGG